MTETDELTGDDTADTADPADSAAAGPAAAVEETLAWWQRLWVHAAMLLVLLLALVPLFDSTAPAFPDEGLYSAQVDNLANGSWSNERPAADIDPDGLGQAMVGALVDGDRQIPYARRPAYPLLLTPAYWLLGSAGLLVVSALATWAAALCSALLGRRLDSRLTLPTLWIVGLGSPLLFDAYLVIGHGLAASLAAGMVLAVTAAIDDRHPWWLAAALPLTATLVLIRSEGTIVVAATAIALMLSSVRWRERSIDPARAVTGVVVGATGAVAYLADGWLARRFSGGLQTNTGSVVSETDPLRAAWIDLLRPWYGDGGNAAASSMLMALCLTFAVLSLRLTPRRPLLPLALLMLAAVMSVVRLTEPIDLISGLIPAFPPLLATMLLHRSDLRRPLVARLGLISLVSVMGLLLTVYGNLDGAQWGGRFFHVLIPLLAPLAVLGMCRGAEALKSRERLIASVAVVVVLASMSAQALQANYQSRRGNSDLVAGTMEFAERNAVAEDALIVIATAVPSGTPRNFWRPLSEGAQVVNQTWIEYLFRVLFAADATGRQEMFVVTDLRPDTMQIILGPPLADAGWRVAERDDVAGTAFTVYQLVPRQSGA